MKISISDLAKEFEIRPGQVATVLNELGINTDGIEFEADADTKDLVSTACLDQLGKTLITLKPSATPRDVANALGISHSDMQKDLISKFKIMKGVSSPLTEDEIGKIVDSHGMTYQTATAVVAKAKPAKTESAAKQGGAAKRPPVVTIMGS